MSMNLLQILLIAVVVVFVIVRRFAGQPLRAGSFVLPLGLAIWGAYELRHGHLGLPELAFLAGEVVAGLALGAARGATIQLYVRDGHLWQRYRWATLAMWGAAIVTRVGMVAAGYAMGLHLPAQSLLVVLGASLLAESAIVTQRAIRTGVPFAPSRRRPVRV
jgi:hypothetical protein